MDKLIDDIVEIYFLGGNIIEILSGALDLVILENTNINFNRILGGYVDEY